jgi:aldose 1-epimerase
MQHDKQTGSVVKSVFGKRSDGADVSLYTLTNRNGLVAKVTDQGAIWTAMLAPDKNGVLGDVTLGFDDLESYVGTNPYFGATVGRVGNRIARGRFELDGKTYSLAINNGPNHLHGGLNGFDKVLWRGEIRDTTDGPSVTFEYLSPDGEEGYPGNLSVTVTYTLTDNDALRIDYVATADAPTPVNLTNHVYFNLAGAGDILDHELTLASKFYTPVDDTLIPTGEIRYVADTPFDFSTPRAIGVRLAQVGGEPVGYDHNFVLENGGKLTPGFAARVREQTTGRVLEMYTTEPGVQFYSGNFLGTEIGKNNVRYAQYTGFCLEAQHFPDSLNHPQFPSVVLRPGQTYRQTTEYRFRVES